MNEFPIDDLRDVDQHDAALHRALPVLESIKSAAVAVRRLGDVARDVGSAVADALKSFAPAEPDPVKGQVSGAPKIARKMSAREVRRANGNFENAAGHPKQLLQASEIRWFKDVSEWEYIATNRAPLRVTAGRTR